MTTTDTGTLGTLDVQITVAGALPVWRHFMVVPANVFDSLVGGSDYLQADTVQVEGSDATDQINAACDTAFTDYDPPTKAELDSGLAGLNDLTAAQVNAEVDTALADYDPPTKAEMDTAFAALNDPTAGAIADQVWDEAISGHVGAGSFGEEVQSHATPTEVNAQCDTAISDASLATATALQTVDDEVGAIQTDLDNGTDGLGALKTAITLVAGYVQQLNDPTAASIADAVWDEVRADHVTANTFGYSCGTTIGHIDVDTTILADSRLTSARAGYLDNLSAGAVSTHSAADVLAETVDGKSVTSILEALTAVLTGVAEPSGSTVIFKKRDGSTAKVTVTYGSSDGERTASAWDDD